jgi:hypothetical protein
MGISLGGLAMSCMYCASTNQAEFPAETNIHFPGLRNAGKPGVFVFPRILVCLDCGFSSFVTPSSELEQLAEVAPAETIRSSETTGASSMPECTMRPVEM